MMQTETMPDVRIVILTEMVNKDQHKPYASPQLMAVAVVSTPPSKQLPNLCNRFRQQNCRRQTVNGADVIVYLETVLAAGTT